MDFTWIVPLLSLGTLLAVVVFALVSKVAIEERIDDTTIPRSTLAKDGPQGGVWFLLPPDRRRRYVPDVEPVLE